VPRCTGMPRLFRSARRRTADPYAKASRRPSRLRRRGSGLHWAIWPSADSRRRMVGRHVGVSAPRAGRNSIRRPYIAHDQAHRDAPPHFALPIDRRDHQRRLPIALVHWWGASAPAIAIASAKGLGQCTHVARTVFGDTRGSDVRCYSISSDLNRTSVASAWSASSRYASCTRRWIRPACRASAEPFGKLVGSLRRFSRS